MSKDFVPSPVAGAVRLALGSSLIAFSFPSLAQETTNLDALVVSATALKVETPLVETPRPASVVDEEELSERNVQSLDETFRYRAGVTSGFYGPDNDTDWIKIRGFDQSTYQDGLRIYRQGFYQWLPETYGLDRVELLKGPASILYGEAPPGGVINAISKRPTDEARGEIQVQAGTNAHRQLGVDTSGPVGDSRDVSYRLVGLYRDGEGDIDYTENERYYVAPSLRWDISDDTSLTLLASFQKDGAVPYNGFKLAYGTIQDTPFGNVAPSTFYGEPGYDTNERTQSALGYSLSHQINNTWELQQDARYSELDLFLRSIYMSFKSGGPREGTRGIVYRHGNLESWTLDNRLVGKWFTDRTENTLLIGVDYQDLETRGKELDNFAFSTIDIFDPSYGNFTPVASTDLTKVKTTKEQTGLYVQNQLRLDNHWVFLAGARYDQADVVNRNLSADSREKADAEEVSLSGGVMYLASNGLSPYLSWTESFQPIAGTDSNGNLYEPRSGEQLEFGVKYAPDDLDGYVTAAIYNIKEKNSLVTNPSGFQVQEGERETQGFEIESVSYLTDQLELTAAYTYNDATSDNTTDNQPEAQADLIPRHSASAWLDYTFQALAPGLKVGGGARYVGGTDDSFTGAKVPSYTLVDLMASYAFADNWEAQLNVNNLADREYVASCEFYCYYGEERSITGTLSYRW